MASAKYEAGLQQQVHGYERVAGAVERQRRTPPKPVRYPCLPPLFLSLSTKSLTTKEGTALQSFSTISPNDRRGYSPPISLNKVSNHTKGYRRWGKTYHLHHPPPTANGAATPNPPEPTTTRTTTGLVSPKRGRGGRWGAQNMAVVLTRTPPPSRKQH